MDEQPLTVEQWMPLVYKVARTKFPWAFEYGKRRRHSVHLAIDGDDLVQEGAIALMKAIVTFRPEVGVPFELHAWGQIQGRMQNYVRDNGGRMKVTSKSRYKRDKVSGTKQAAQDCVLMSEVSLEDGASLDSILLTEKIEQDAQVGQDGVDNQELLGVCLAKLGGRVTPEMLRALEMRGGGETMAAIGEELGVPRKTAEMLVHKAVKVAAVHLKEEAEAFGS